MHENTVMIHWRPVGDIQERETWFEALLFYNSAEQQQESETLIITVVEGEGEMGGGEGGNWHQPLSQTSQVKKLVTRY
jgi:hypothetical protein